MVEQLLLAMEIKYKIITLDQVGSTNDYAMAGNFPHGTIITAREQNAGRGQRGNVWRVEPGQNLTFSLVIEPTHIPIVEQFRISMIASMAACDAIRSYGVDCKVKWPNDLYVDNNKISGILIEHSLMGPYLTQSVIGIGINVNQMVFDPRIPNPTSMACCGVETIPNEVLERFCVAFNHRYNQSTLDLHQQYMANLWRGIGLHCFRDPALGEFRAKIDQVDPATGMLTLLTEHGESRSYWFKEVEYIM